VPAFRFRTFVNQYERQRRWPGAQPAQRADYTLDPRGFTDSVTGYSPGPDGAIDTADDVIDGSSVYTYADDGAFLGADSYNAAGAMISTSVYDQSDAGQTRMRSFSAPGPDTQWHTADDVVSYWITFAYDDQDRLIRQVSYVGGGAPGPDGVPFTADDVPSSAYSTSYPSPTHVQILQYNGPGPDAVWLTADDAVFTRTENTLDDGGIVVESQAFDAANAQLFRSVNELDPSGLLTRSLRYNPDDSRTADYSVITYDAGHHRTRVATLATADDHELSAYFQFDVER
jgi:hypothetical protein